MPANQKPSRGRRITNLAAAAAFLCSAVLGSTGAVHGVSTTAAESAAAAAARIAGEDVTRFGVGSPAMVQAEVIGVRYWGASSVCSGVVEMSWASLAPTVNAASNWWNPVAAYGNAPANAECKITFNAAQEFDWPMFCTVMVHEIGHLIGRDHVSDPNAVMYPIYVTPIADCTGPMPGAPSGPALAGAHSATRSATTSGKGHKAVSRHKTHKRKRVTRKH